LKLKQIAVVSIAALVGGCSSGAAKAGIAAPGGIPELRVFTTSTSFHGTATLTPGTLYDLGVPPLNNTTTNTIHVRSVALVHVIKTMGPPSYAAYAYKTVGNNVIAARGNLQSHCPHHFQPLPIGRIVVHPKSTADDFVMVSLRPASAGRYPIGNYRITFTVNNSSRLYFQEVPSLITLHVHPGKATGFYKGEC
jgi:hypothetical protein